METGKEFVSAKAGAAENAKHNPINADGNFMTGDYLFNELFSMGYLDLKVLK
jgi:hypothetical protein